MKLRVFETDKLVGTAEVFALDPPMGVAMAKFDPAADYDPKRHANVIDGDYVGDRGEALRIEMVDGSMIKSGAISIQDFPTLNEREVHILGIYEPSFADLFNSHPHYRAYYDLDLTDEQRAEKQRMLTIKRRRRSMKEWAILGGIVATVAGTIVILA